MDNLRRETRFALRRLLATPIFTAFAITSLALGIGVTTAIYSVMHSAFWRPVNVKDVDRVVDIVVTSGRTRALNTMSHADFEDLQTQQTTFAGLAASSRLETALVGRNCVERAAVEAVNGAYFSTLGIGARIGRVIQPSDDGADAAPVVVLSERFWRSNCGADSRIIGSTVKLAGHPFEVVGVGERGFQGIHRYQPSEIWIPLSATQLIQPGSRVSPGQSAERSRLSLSVKGRLKADAAKTQAAGEVALIGKRLDMAYPPDRTSGLPRAWSVTAVDETLQPFDIAVLFMGAVFTVLLIACTNLANLGLARGSARQNELAVRAALGASRWRVVREQLIESAIVAIAGGASGVLLARSMAAYFAGELSAVRSGGLLPVQSELDPVALAVAASMVVLSLMVVGLWPAIQLTRPSIRTPLSSGVNSTPPQWTSHRRLLMWQVFGSVGLLLVGGFGLVGFRPSASQDPGIDVERLALAQLNFQLNGRDENEARRIVGEIRYRVSMQPGIEAVSASVGLPFGLWDMPSIGITTPNRPFVAGANPPRTSWVVSGTENIFRTLGVRITRGRGFDDRDSTGAPAVAVVSESFARTIFGATDALGRTFLTRGRRSGFSELTEELVTVIGIAGDTAVGWAGNGNLIYRPIDQYYEPAIVITARTSGDAATVAAALRSAIRGVDAELAPTAIGPGSRLLAHPVLIVRRIATFGALLGAAALLLAMVGLYGVLSHIVVQRTREVGVRMALGADARRITRLVLTDGFKPVLDGLALGIIGGVLGRLALRTALPELISVFEPLSFGLTSAAVVVATIFACYLPARRAARLQPTVALREL